MFDDDVCAIIRSPGIFCLCFKMVSFRGPKKVGPHPDWSQGFNSKLRPGICTPPLSYGSPNLTTSAHSFFYMRNVQVFSIFEYPTMHSVCPPTLPFFCINYCCRMLQGGLLIPESIEKQSVIQNLRQTDLECIMGDLHGAKMRI